MAMECIVKNDLGTITIVEDVIAPWPAMRPSECIGIVAMAL